MSSHQNFFCQGLYCVCLPLLLWKYFSNQMCLMVRIPLTPQLYFAPWAIFSPYPYHLSPFLAVVFSQTAFPPFLKMNTQTDKRLTHCYVIWGCFSLWQKYCPWIHYVFSQPVCYLCLSNWRSHKYKYNRIHLFVLLTLTFYSTKVKYIFLLACSM